MTLPAEAWQADYTDHVRPDLNEAFLRRMMAGATWVGMLVGTEAGQPVAFELALERTPYCRQVPLRAYYTEDRYACAVREPRRALAPFITVQPPFFIDFT